MRKSYFTKLKGLFYSALLAVAVISCENEKPEIKFPDGPQPPQKEYKFLETITFDTLTFIEGDSAVVNLRTVPYNLLSRDSVDIQINDSTGQKYKFATLRAVRLRPDSIWNLVLRLEYGMKSGDEITVMVADSDTTMYSNPIVLRMIPRPQPSSVALRIVSDSVSAFEKGGSPTIRVRTQPWDMLFNDSTYTLSVTDASGSLASEQFTFESMEFMPDSTWAVKVTINDSKLYSAFITATIQTPDTVLVSNAVEIMKVSFKMSSVKTGNNNTMKFNSGTQTYSYCQPTVTDFTQQQFLFTHTGHKVTLGDTLLAEGQYNTLDASQPLTVSVWCYDLHKDYIIKVTNTGLPIVRIDTKGQSVTRRDTWVEGTSMRIELPDGTVDFEGTLSLKGRGNGTWTETNKKPYAIRLDEKAKILGMHKQKRWILLANYKDRTLLRNDAAFWLSRHTEMPYTVSGQFVELVWNGKHMGNYYLCEQARIDNHRIDIVSPNLTDPEKGGIFMEIDAFLDYTSSDRADKSPEIGFWSTGASNRYKLPYIFKDPDGDENGNLLTSSSATYKYMVDYVKKMEDAIYKSDENDDWMNYLDIDRAVDFALLNEITMNHDSYNTWPAAGPHSGFLYKDSCGPICFGPIWDFDYHTFTLYNDCSQGQSWSSSENPRIKQWEILKMDNKGSSGGWGGWGGSSSGNKYYFADLAKRSPKFKARLLERWDQYKYVWKDSLPVYIDQMADHIRQSESYNISVWAENTSKGNYKQNGDFNLSFDDAVNAMKTAFLKRWQWMDENLSKL